MVFCFENCMTYCEKTLEKLLNFEAEGLRICKSFEITKQFIQTEKGQNSL